MKGGRFKAGGGRWSGIQKGLSPDMSPDWVGAGTGRRRGDAGIKGLRD